MKKYIRSNRYDSDVAEYSNLSYRDKLAIAQHTSDHILLKLLSNEYNTKDDSLIRYEVAANPYTDDSILEQLSHDEYARVRHAVASNPNTSEATLCQLAYDRDIQYVAQPAIQRMHTKRLLNELSASDNDIIRYAVACNPNTPLSTLKYLSENDEDEDVREEAFNTMEEL